MNRLIDPRPWQAEMNRRYAERLELMKYYAGTQWGEPPAPLTWRKRMAYRVRYSVRRFRERLGELIAGRQFDE